MNKKVLIGLSLLAVGVNAFALTDNFSMTQNMSTRYKMELGKCYSVLKDMPSQQKYFGGNFKRSGSTGLDAVGDASYNEATKNYMLGSGYNMIKKGSDKIIRDSAQLFEIGFIIAGGLKNGLEHVVVDPSEENEIRRKYPNVGVVQLSSIDTSGNSGAENCTNIYVALDKELIKLYLNIVNSFGGAAYFNGDINSYKIGPLLMNVEPLKLTAGGYTIYSNDSDSYLGYSFPKGNAFIKKK